MNRARIEELVAHIHSEAEKRGLILVNHDDYIRAALTTLARECAELMGPIELYNPEYRNYFRCIERIRKLAEALPR